MSSSMAGMISTFTYKSQQRKQHAVPEILQLEDELLSPTEMESIMASHGFAPDGSVNSIQNRWCHINDHTNNNNMYRVYQCFSGRPPQTTSKNRREWPYVKCTAFVTIKCIDSKAVNLCGFLTHTDACQRAPRLKAPPTQISSDIYARAKGLLAQGLSSHQVLNDSLLYVQQRFGMVMFSEVGERLILTPRDLSNIIRTVRNEKFGIDTDNPPAQNLDKLVNDLNNGDTRVRDAVFYYQPILTQGDILKIGISTPDQCQLAWEIAHKRLIIMDGTFGISKSRILLFVMMGVDQGRRGVPLAYFLFSAPPQAKNTAANYDTSILTEFLKKWKETLEIFAGRRSQTNPSTIKFTPVVAMTDTDTKERAALLTVWPSLVLLLCWFHLTQCFKNMMTKLLGRGGGKETVRQRAAARSQMWSLTDGIRKSRSNEEALSNYQSWKSTIMTQQLSSTFTCQILDFGIYIHDFWMTSNLELLPSWTLGGLLHVAEALGILIENLPTTSNHNETYNNIFKNKYLVSLQRGGQRSRYDILVAFICITAIPEILLRRKMQIIQDDETIRCNQFFNVSKTSTHNVPGSLAYFEPDASRDCQAAEIVRNRTRGGFCKHMRAALIIMNRELTRANQQPFVPLDKQAAIRRWKEGFGEDITRLEQSMNDQQNDENDENDENDGEWSVEDLDDEDGDDADLDEMGASWDELMEEMAPDFDLNDACGGSHDISFSQLGLAGQLISRTVAAAINMERIMATFVDDHLQSIIEANNSNINHPALPHISEFLEIVKSGKEVVGRIVNTKTPSSTSSLPHQKVPRKRELLEPPNEKKQKRQNSNAVL
ncbi:hypothetical protein HDU76_007770 [Blyttiomyces sp. JEL0837]|nr:hypothetical protein HDU76_007770 [Blyttiomyces sp. JEL0837]